MKYREKKGFLKKGGQTLAQVAWRACGVSIIQDTQNPTGHAPEKPAAAVCALSRGWASYSSETPSCLNCSVFCLLELGSLIRIAPCLCKINTNVWGHQSISLPSVGTARNVMPMARDVINYPLLQQMLHGVRHVKRKTFTEDQTETSDSNIPCKEWMDVLCIRKPFSSKIKLLFSNKRLGLNIQLFYGLFRFFLIFFLFNSY